MFVHLDAVIIEHSALYTFTHITKTDLGNKTANI